jgi:glycosyltransferase involved in cell wall biosynthesis
MTEFPVLDYSIIIPAYNEEDFLDKTLASVKDAQSVLRQRSGEVIVVDNNSTDRTAQIARDLGADVVFEPVNQISRARNAGARKAAGKYLIFLDADTMLSPELLVKSIELLESGAIVGGGTIVDNAQVDLFREILLINLWNFISRCRNLAAGLFLFCLRDAWRDVGGFDETVYIAEELIFSKQLKKWGKKRKLKFQILDIPIETSWRKYQWFDYKTLVVSLSFGWFFKKNKEKCHIWYDRSNVKAAKKEKRI